MAAKLQEKKPRVRVAQSAAKAQKANGKRRRGWMFRVLLAMAGLCVVGFLGAGILFYLAWRDLPQIDSLDTYRPLAPLRIYSMDGQLIGEYGEQIRTVVPVERIPQRLKQAFISVEDASFYSHFGINPKGILRAAFINIIKGKVSQGGSTITQQLAKTFWLSPKRSYMRKLKEAILAINMERHMTKDEILWLYCNQIYLGHNAYGVAAAARNYFRKDLADLTLGEMALIAGLPKAPGNYSPLRNPKRSRKRQEHVLNRMVEEGFIDEAQKEAALAEAIAVYPPPDSHTLYAPYYAEQVRRDLLDRTRGCIRRFNGLQDPAAPPPVDDILAQRPPQKWGDPMPTAPVLPTEEFCIALEPIYYDILSGDERSKVPETHSLEETLLYRSGFSIETASELRAEFLAQDAILFGLRRLTKRQGYNGPDGQLPQEDWERLRAAFGAARPGPSSFRRDEIVPGLIIAVDDDGKKATVDLGSVTAKLSVEDAYWARKPRAEVRWENERVTSLKKIFKPGDIIAVRPSDAAGINDNEDFRSAKPLPADPALWRLDLIQWPFSNAALMAKDVHTGYVRSMVGGWNYEQSQFNRPVQACRQPGSSFKPIVYTAALDPELGSSAMTPASIIVDSPVVNQDENMRWMPDNYEGDFAGDTPVVKCLALSKNICAVKALQHAGVQNVIKWARRLGVKGTINYDYSISLGSSCVTLDELTGVYSYFPRLGKSQDRVAIRVIRDAYGTILEDNRVPSDPYLLFGADTVDRLTWAALHPPRQVMPETLAYQMLTLMQQVTARGTGAAASALKRPVAGKTGTTNDSFDAWFVGYTADLVVGVWMGFDGNERHLGRGETGGSVSLPPWMDFMSRYLADEPVVDFPPTPEGLTWMAIDFDTGKRVGEGTESVVSLPFRPGTGPTEVQGENQGVDTEELLQGGGPL